MNLSGIKGEDILAVQIADYDTPLTSMAGWKFSTSTNGIGAIGAVRYDTEGKEVDRLLLNYIRISVIKLKVRDVQQN